MPPGEKRSYKVLVSLNDAERDVLVARAGEMPLAALLRELSLKSARRSQNAQKA